MAGSLWTCPTCKTSVTTLFCSQCGERPLAPRDLTLRGLAAKLVHALTSVDTKLLRTVVRLLRHPGTLTVAYMEGQRKPYVAPFQLFLLANVLFFAVQSLTNTNIFGSSLESHLHQQDWSELAQSMLSKRLEAKHISLDDYAPRFDQAAVINAKSLIILMAVPFALLLPLVFLHARRPFATHAVFSLHLYAFLLLLFSVSVLVAAIDVLIGGAGLKSPRIDNVLSVFNLLACMTYLYFAIGPVYGAMGPMRALKAIALAVCAAVLVLGYRFVLFVITLYGT